MTAQWVMTLLGMLYCGIIMGNNIVRDTPCDVTMGNGIAMCTYHGITMGCYKRLLLCITMSNYDGAISPVNPLKLYT